MFKDKNGKISSKRICGFICILAGIVIAFVKGGTEAIPVLSTGTLLLGVGVLEKSNPEG